MRFRTLFTLSTGAAVGAGVMYLLDPEHGEVRRRQARRQALRQARVGASATLVRARRRAEEAVTAGIDGYRQARQESENEMAP